MLLYIKRWLTAPVQLEDGTLSPVGPFTTHDEIKDLLFRRIDEVVLGFLEGVWGGDDELSLTEARAVMLTAMEEAARPYQELLSEVVTRRGIWGSEFVKPWEWRRGKRQATHAGAPVECRIKGNIR